MEEREGTMVFRADSTVTVRTVDELLTTKIKVSPEYVEKIWGSQAADQYQKAQSAKTGE